MTNEMIERVSEAILNTPNASDYKTLVAINAIKAMREPTEGMIVEGAKHVVLYKNANDVYQAMIDQILK